MGVNIPRCLTAVLIIVLLASGSGCTTAPAQEGSGTPDAAVAAPAVPQEIPMYRYEIVNIYPHDPGAFTEGLAYDRGTLLESSGLPYNATLRRVEIATGTVLATRRLPPDVVAEGVAVANGTIVMLDGNSGTGTLFDAETLEATGAFSYPGDGWGLASNGRYIVMSNGTQYLTFIDPATFRTVRTIAVTARGRPVLYLNELEYVDGEIWANVFPTDVIVRIAPETGDVTGIIDLSGLFPMELRKQAGDASTGYFRRALPPGAFAMEACTNGIAYDPEGGRLFVTGKLWPALYEIRVVPS
jgi:glutaminyl-peptide cyclotransferase